MYTTQEMIDTQRKSWTVHEIHLHCLDVLKHILKGDHEQTVFGDESPQRRYLDELIEAMGEHASESGLDMAKHEWYRPVKRTTEVASEVGWVDVDSYINKDPRMFNEPVKIRKNMPGVTIVLDMVLPYCDRDKSYMKVRHQKIYDLIMKLEGLGYPTRVVAVCCMGIPELHGKGMKARTGKKTSNFASVITIKDWKDPIFAGIWGAFKNNASTNAFLNCFMDYVIGTYDGGNGYCQYLDCEELFPPWEQVCIIDGRYISFKGQTDNYEEFINR